VEGYLAQVTVARYDKQENRTEELLRKALEAGPASCQAHTALANFCLGAAKKYAEAETRAREALHIDASRINAHSILVAALIAQEKWAAVEPALAEAEKNVPDDLSPYFRAAGACLSKPADLARAERYFRKYLTQEAEPHAASHSRAHWRLGQVLEKQGRKADAIAEWQASVKLDPESPAKQDLKRTK
jgi:tetratricopeptide (TPR) repeat protein